MSPSAITPWPSLDDAALRDLVTAFYQRVLEDAALGPVFDAAIAPAAWPRHLERMAEFWSSVMLASGRYHGSPMSAHLRHAKAISPQMFDRWLQLWTDTARCRLAPQDAEAITAKAHHMAKSLQLALFS